MPEPQFFKLKTKQAVKWNWPLRIGLIPNEKAEQVAQSINDLYWSKAYGLMSAFQMRRGLTRANVLIFPEGIEKGLKQIVKLNYAVNADIVIFFYKGKKAENLIHPKVVNLLCKKIHCNAVLFVKSAEIAYFVDGLVFNLSHNHNLKKTLELMGPEATCFLSDSIEKNTTLTRHLSRMLKKLNKNIKKDKLFLKHLFLLKSKFKRFLPPSSIPAMEKSSSSGGAVEMSHEEIIFPHESGEANEAGDSVRETTEEIPEQSLGSHENPEIDKKNRYLKAWLYDDQGKKEFTYLEVNKLNNIAIQIGYRDESALQIDAPINLSKIKSDKKEKWKIHLVMKFQGRIQSQTILLPKAGESNVWKAQLLSDQTGYELIQIYAFHKNRLLQSVNIAVHFVERISDDNRSLPPAKIESAKIIRAELDELKTRLGFSQSIQYDDLEGELLGVNDTTVKFLQEEGLSNLLKKLRATIESVVKQVDDYPEDLENEDVVKVMKKLAFTGSRLYRNYLTKLGSLDGPLQLILSTHQHIPIEFAYTFPPPKKSAQMCPQAKEHLLKGKCKGDCMDMSVETNAEYICPFGFLNYSRIIERHDIKSHNELLEQADFAVHAEPIGDRATVEVLSNTMFAATKKVENNSPGLIKKVASSIKKVSASFKQTKDWEGWEKAIEKTKSEVLVLLVHREEDEFDSPQIEIGDGKFITDAELSQAHIVSTPDGQAPLVILIGCRTADTDIPFLDFTSEFKNKGAAMVLSNFTKIRGRQAGPIVQLLFEFFKEQKGHEIAFGAIILKLKQHLIAKGILVSLALVTQGDADWKLKL